MKTVPLAGGLPSSLAAAPRSWGATWSEGGWIIYSPTLNSGLWRISEDGGPAEQLTHPDFADTGYAHTYPQYLPDGRTLLFNVWGHVKDGATHFSAAVLSLDTMQWQPMLLTDEVSYVPTGHLLFNSWDGQLSATPFDLSSLSPKSNSVGVLADIFSYPYAGYSFSISGNGTLAYPPIAPPEQLVWVDRQGRVEALEFPAGSYVEPRLSPGGDRVAVLDMANSEGTLRVIDILSGTPTTIPTVINTKDILWMPNGRNMAFSSNRVGSWDIYSIDVDSGGEAEELLVKEFDQFPRSWSPDERLLVYEETDPLTSADLWILSRDDNDMRPFVVTPGNDYFAQFSPDGKWLAYVSDETGRDQAYICSFPDCADRRTVSFGTEPKWSSDGQELFFRNGNQMWAVEIRDQTNMTLGERQALFKGQFRTPDIGFGSYDVHPDGDRFLMITDSPKDEIRVAQNWFEELKARVPTN